VFGEQALVFMGDLDADADTRAGRRVWRLVRGRPRPGRPGLLLAGFEEAEEILSRDFPRATPFTLG